MKNVRRLLTGLGLAALLGLAVACQSEAMETPDGGVGAGSESDSIAQALGQLGGYGGSGIQVTGEGKVTITPDLALLNLGVEAMADTVAEARADAATAMAAVIAALKANGIADADVQTSYFNISPEYTYQEVSRGDSRYSERVLVGYLVTNNVTAKVRNLDSVGATIDATAEAGGNAARIQNIRFTVEDSSSAKAQARESAVKDALDKADHFASLAGVNRGSLLSISESGGGVPITRSFAFDSFAMSENAAATPISAGELEIAIYVQAVFAIESP